MSSQYAFDVQTATFETEVIAKSREVPILLDFWADWCGPCKTLRPVLDKLADEFAGAFLLGAVDSEAEQQLAYAFQVQSIPFCVLLVDGRPVDAFQGALPEPEIRKFLERAGLEPAADSGVDVEEDPGRARLDAARAALGRGDWRAAEEALDGFPDDHDGFAVAGRMRDGLELFSATLDAGESPAAEAAVRGRDLFLGAEFAAAVDAWIESIEADRNWRGGLSRRAAVMAFEILGVNDAGRELVRELRGRMATLLY